MKSVDRVRTYAKYSWMQGSWEWWGVCAWRALLETAEAFYGGDEVVGAGERLGIASECVALSIDEAGHAVEHRGYPLLICAEADEHGAVILDISVGHVATKDVSELMLIGASDMGV